MKCLEKETLCFSLFLDTVKTVKLYVYNVYFKDSTECGDKEVTKSTAIENSMPVEVSGQS